ncbi:NAD(P)-binding protein [Nadsonia fulvescens var. elongata DSM 6958]|uniref:NAD(P)-binding protein n=1 Tax=Nadsonia fulvescens var. elongata DSM 6958 TaxID=857566 RepID=A0A1E3PGN9_9ASCO|nr:NAD(P)-binding protein [Nadsonia fulvescens var. elongata DSM 6958]
MPFEFINSVAKGGTSAIPYYSQIRQYGPYIAGLIAIKSYFGGASNSWERDMHGRVVILTGGTSGVGAAVAEDMARRGAQIIFLVRNVNDGWLIDFINDLRYRSNNHLLYAEEADLSDLHSIRKFATKWLDNSPPRRLDTVICCAGTAPPPGTLRLATKSDIEQQFLINYLGHYHLLNLLSPALRVQPPDRDVRIILTGCLSHVLADLDLTDLEFSKRGYPVYKPWKSLGAAKLCLSMYAEQLQRQLVEYTRPDGSENNVKVVVADPGMMRSPSFKRFFSLGSVWGLLLYLLLWPIWWLFFKTSIQGAQTILFAVYSAEVIQDRTGEAVFLAECKIKSKKSPRSEISDEGMRTKLVEVSDKYIEIAERKMAIQRNKLKANDDLEKKSGNPVNVKIEELRENETENETENEGVKKSKSRRNRSKNHSKNAKLTL